MCGVAYVILYEALLCKRYQGGRSQVKSDWRQCDDNIAGIGDILAVMLSSLLERLHRHQSPAIAVPIILKQRQVAYKVARGPHQALHEAPMGLWSRLSSKLLTHAFGAHCPSADQCLGTRLC